MWPFKLSLQITTYSSIVLGLFVLLQNRKANINRVFFVFSILVAIYTYFLGGGSFSQIEEQALINFRLMYIGVILIPVVYYHLTLQITGSKSKILLLFYSIAAFFLFLIPFPVFIAGTRYFEEYKIYALNPGTLYHPFLILFFGALIYSLTTAIKKYKTSYGLQKIQLAYFIYGSSIGFIGGTIDFLPKYGIFIHPLNTYCNYLIAIYIAVFAYAIIKYRLMDIRVIIRKSLVYSSIVALFTGLYLITIFIMSHAFQTFTGHSSMLIAILLLLVIAFVFQPLKSKTQSFVDKIFFKEKYNYQKTLRELSQASTSIINLDELLKLVSKTVVERLNIDQTSVYTLGEKGTTYKLTNIKKRAS